MHLPYNKVHARSDQAFCFYTKIAKGREKILVSLKSKRWKESFRFTKPTSF
jgi:hypothetical protein